MQSIIWTGRLVSRVLWNNLSNNYVTASESGLKKKSEPCILSVVSGVPKNFHGKKNINGKFGDDAWFSAKWKSADVIGVADGVGGWREHGIDPGEFSTSLMRNCERFVTSGRFCPTDPIRLLACSYYELFENKQQVLGSSTACIVMLNKETCMVYTANIGDSGFLIVRGGQVVHRSEEQQHYFNTPYQLSVPPPDHSISALTDSPESADKTNFRVEDGDVILLATDGVFDNVPDQLLLIEMTRLEGERDPVKIQTVANTIALMARRLAFDQNFMSPFAKAASRNGIYAIGGKPDDITVLLATIAL